MPDPHIPEPPSDAEVKRISEQQKYLHDDWTGDGCDNKTPTRPKDETVKQDDQGRAGGD
ncbi:hypothetical protein C882_4453 [Caenispirillum salinarum AK4]|uniref:Uncharacterized protein n=1 Tax=Caenispirillum salinarum AK4 TaxID=1238182 RepID=K9H0B2_9PROT|nr:hypothetical protein [Caenispirillum salinarum]EKV30494.1 hypothetical protein C882_4453 [Caenispirillum salinarum AK4]